MEPVCKRLALSYQPSAKIKKLKADSSPKWLNSYAIRCNENEGMM